MDKLITLPQKTLKLFDEGRDTGKTVNTFIHFLGLVLESAPHKNETDTYLAHSIREKIDDLKPTAKTLKLEESEIVFIERGVDSLRGKGAVSGSGWYYLIDPLRSAKPASKEK